MGIEDFLPEYDTAHSHQIRVDAPPTAVRRALLELNLADDIVVGSLLRLRGLPRRATTWSGLQDIGFVHLANEPDELVLGIVGKFWTITGNLVAVDAARFQEHGEPGYAKAVWNFTIFQDGEGTRLGTETRVLCSDDASRARFRRYWRVVGPLSGLIRKRILKQVSKTLEH